MKIVVIGATGTIGSAVASLFEEKGHDVVRASRSTQPSVDFTSEASLDRFFADMGPVDALITVGGDAALAGLDKLTDEQIRLSLTSKLMGQINTVRKGLGNLKAGGVAIVTGGMLAYQPWPETSIIAMVNAGLEGFIKGAALDFTEGRRAVIVHPPLVAETAASWGMDAAPWPDAAKVAIAYLTAVEGTGSGHAVFVEGYGPNP